MLVVSWKILLLKNSTTFYQDIQYSVCKYTYIQRIVWLCVNKYICIYRIYLLIGANIRLSPIFLSFWPTADI